MTPAQVSRRRAEFAPNSAAEAAARLGALLGTFIAAQVETKEQPERDMPKWSDFGPDPQRIFQAVVDFFEPERIARLGVVPPAEDHAVEIIAKGDRLGPRAGARRERHGGGRPGRAEVARVEHAAAAGVARDDPRVPAGARDDARAARREAPLAGVRRRERARRVPPRARLHDVAAGTGRAMARPYVPHP